MPHLSREQRVKLYTSLFKGRKDVYAYRWKSWNSNKSGYSPAYTDKTKKQYSPLTEDIIEQHLLGNKIVGVYPLLTDNTSWFVVADFDTPNCLPLITKLIEVCRKYKIETYIERSRSGNGFHAWWFLEGIYPACKSRKIFLHLLKEAKIIDPYDKADSFDRLFPNQDYLSGKGLGNLIALPLQGQSRKQGNTVFLDPEQNFNLTKDQWQLLQSIKRVSLQTLDNLFDQFSNTSSLIPQTQQSHTPNRTPKDSIQKTTLPITLSTHIILPKQLILKNLANFLAEHLNFFNTEYAVKQKMGLSTYDTERYFKTIEKTDEHILIPRGFLPQLLAYLKETNIKYAIHNGRTKLKPLKKLALTCTLFDYQKETLKAFNNQDTGILVAPPGSGKTVMGLSLIAEKKQPALIITHRKQIYTQWLERIEQFLQIPKKDIGQITSTEKTIKSPLTVSTIQTLVRLDNLKEKVSPLFGFILDDECHHMPAKMFRKIITQFSPHYLYGLTATPIRKHNDEKLIFIYLGEILREVSRNDIQKKSQQIKKQTVSINIRETNLTFPFNVHTRNYQRVSKVLIFDTARNEQIVKDVKKEVEQGKKCLLLTERKEHINTLNLYLGNEYETITLTGDLGVKKKREKATQIKSGHFQIILATGQYVGEGMHFEDLDTLFLVYPCSFTGKLTQYIGRVLHSKNYTKTVYDYRDINIPYFERMFKKRQKYYEKEYGGGLKV
ncbi:MAG: DEAD/DEAH box helicase family protein [Parcubacteria group bacterium]|nr:DEAD/DEAH box helicase family protein [Parcubacteria group bacterium]